ncbi:MAG: FecR domain-containing protein [Muribaculaceae bacterium]|nr:FecR domain-containing protein [Muribaculaceae bacterium]
MGKQQTDIDNVVRRLVDYVNSNEVRVDPDDVMRSWFGVSRAVRVNRRRRVYRRVALLLTASAAMIVLFVGFPFLRPSAVDSADSIKDYAMQNLPMSDSDNDNIVLMISDNERIDVEKEEAEIVYTAQGDLTVNSDTVSAKPKSVDAVAAPVYSQLIVPKGRRSQLLLSDGTRVWVNSGTRVVYPQEFAADRREVIVEGEAYLEVASDVARPFTVITRDFNVCVTGTSFNVSAYPMEPEASVVLVGGRVTVDNGKGEHVALVPGQYLAVDSAGVFGTPVDVDVAPYVSWIHNMLIYSNEPLAEVFKKLELYYGCRFAVDPIVSEMRVSGKLDLKKSLDEVISVIAYSAQIVCAEEEGFIYVRPE